MRKSQKTEGLHPVGQHREMNVDLSDENLYGVLDANKQIERE